MVWAPLIIRDIGDDADSIMYAKPSDETNGFVTDEHDGQVSTPVNAVAVSLKLLGEGGAKTEDLMRAAEIKASLYITDSRVVIACTKFDKGGGWVGGLSAVALNAASKARAAYRSRGQALVGQIRYPWLVSVGFTSKSGWTSSEQLRLVSGTRHGDGAHNYLLDITFPKSVAAAKVGREIVSRAARHRLQRVDPDSEAATALEQLVDPPELTPVKGKFVSWRVPGAKYALTSTALPALHGAEAAGESP